MEKKQDRKSACQDSDRSCCSPEDPRIGVDRREFVKFAGLGAASLSARSAGVEGAPQRRVDAGWIESIDPEWPVLRRYHGRFVHRLALPLGGIGTGTVSLGGRGDLRDWEIMNRPAKGFVPSEGEVHPFFALFAETGQTKVTKILEGPLESSRFEGSHGCETPNENLPRFAESRVEASYPFMTVSLRDPEVPLEADLRAFNPLVPGDVEKSSYPAAFFSVRLHNPTSTTVTAAVAGTLPNFVGIDGWTKERDWKGDRYPVGAKENRNSFREDNGIRGIYFDSEGVTSRSPAFGSLALTTTAREVTFRESWLAAGWGTPWIDFWDDFGADGLLSQREWGDTDSPLGSLAARVELEPGQTVEIPFLLTWHFPNRYSWDAQEASEEDRWVGNFYTERFQDAWEVAAKLTPLLPGLRKETSRFVGTFLSSDLPREVKEAALFNLSTLRSQTCFRTPDGKFFGWEGCADEKGCCFGSCTHVWNYEQATPFLFAELAHSMREVEFLHATNAEGLMSFRTQLPLQRAQDFGKAAADGQMGTVMKAYREWQLSGDRTFLERLWPSIRKVVEFCWIEGGWDADQDGVMEGAQHNTMDVEYYGPNPQMGLWYLGALRAAEEMAGALGEDDFARKCRRLFERGSRWLDENLFNGEYYEHQVRVPDDVSAIAPSLLVGMGAADPTHPEYQLEEGCLVDQLVGQYMAHVCGLGYLVSQDHVRTTLASIKKYNHRSTLSDHFNSMRSFALNGEAALLMASYPKGRPENPFPYYSEVMTGFEYTAAIGLLFEDLVEEGLSSIRDIRNRYDGYRRNPFDEAECGHHYARAMASWGAVLALTEFHYSAVDALFRITAKPGIHFWSNGDAWGVCEVGGGDRERHAELSVLRGRLSCRRFELAGYGRKDFEERRKFREGETVEIRVERD